MSDLCECGILKSKCTHPNCSDMAEIKPLKISKELNEQLKDIGIDMLPKHVENKKPHCEVCGCDKDKCTCNDSCESCGA